MLESEDDFSDTLRTRCNTRPEPQFSIGNRGTQKTSDNKVRHIAQTSLWQGTTPPTRSRHQPTPYTAYSPRPLLEKGRRPTRNKTQEGATPNTRFTKVSKQQPTAYSSGHLTGIWPNSDCVVLLRLFRGSSWLCSGWGRERERERGNEGRGREEEDKRRGGEKNQKKETKATRRNKRRTGQQPTTCVHVWDPPNSHTQHKRNDNATQRNICHIARLDDGKLGRGRRVWKYAEQELFRGEPQASSNRNDFPSQGPNCREIP